MSRKSIDVGKSVRHTNTSEHSGRREKPTTFVHLDVHGSEILEETNKVEQPASARLLKQRTFSIEMTDAINALHREEAEEEEPLGHSGTDAGDVQVDDSSEEDGKDKIGALQRASDEKGTLNPHAKSP